MSDFPSKIRILLVVSGIALMVAACGDNDQPAQSDETATTEMLSTDTTLDGTTNDATSLDAAAGLDNEVIAPANEAEAGNTVE